MASSSLNESNPSGSSKYDVFLSFRGEDTRHTFTGNLYNELRNAGFCTFLDDYGIDRGEEIRSELEKAIQASRISIVVLSENYPSSSWCLEELVMILEQRRTRAHVVLPVFYYVDPSHFRKQVGSVGEAFRRHEENFKAKRNNSGDCKIKAWKVALTEVANLAGTTFDRQVDGYEYKCIEEIVREVKNKTRRPCYTDHYLVGMNHHIRELSRWLNYKSNEVRVLVMHGLGGIGKTTIAKLVYNENYTRFDGSSFLINIREHFETPDGLLKLQRKLLSDIQGQYKAEKPEDIDDGWDYIKRALRFKRSFLLVLDDVADKSQLDEILRMKDWLFKRSKIIITTRRLDLSKSCEAYESYMVENLCYDESLVLFSWYAFGQDHPKENYEEKAECFAGYCDGLPLALKVLGSALFGKDVDRWDHELNKLKESPKKNITRILKISFESLEDDSDKNIFLDIACFFIGKDKDFAIAILDGCDFHASIGVENLIDRCLLSIDHENKLAMHQLIQDTGKQISRENSKKYPEQCSRLWNHKDVLNVLESKTGTEDIEGLTLDLKNSNTKPLLETDAFKRMQRLRILQLNYARFNGTYKVFPFKLRWLCWHGFPVKSISNDFSLEKLIALDMRHSSLNLWKGTKSLGSLKYLNLSHSYLLTRTPDFFLVPNLEKLLLKGCPKLVEIDESLSKLEKLSLLNLKGCILLKKLPKNICNVKSLKKLIISGCSNLFGVADELKMMSSLESLVADETDLGKVLLPTEPLRWFSRQKKMREISWRSLPRSLVSLSLMDCNLSEKDIPMEFSNLRMLRDLNLGNNPFNYLPNCIEGLPNLLKLDLRFCKGLRLLEWSCIRLSELDARECESLSKIASQNLNSSCDFELDGCQKLRQVQDQFARKYVKEMDVEALNIMGFFNLDSMADTEIYTTGWSYDDHPIEVKYEDGAFCTTFPGKEVPDWFKYKSESLHIALDVPRDPNVRIRGLNLCLLYTSSDPVDICVSIEVINKSKNLTASSSFGEFGDSELTESMVWLGYWLFGILFEGGDHVEVLIDIDASDLQINECGVNFLVDDYEEEKSTVIQNLKSLLLSGYLDKYVDVKGFSSVLPVEFFDGNFRILINWRHILRQAATEMDAKELNMMGFFNLDRMEEIYSSIWRNMRLPIQVAFEYDVFTTSFLGRKVPEWFSHKSMKSIISLDVPSRPNSMVRGFNLCLALAVSPPVVLTYTDIGIQVINKSKKLVVKRFFRISNVFDPRVWLSYWLFGILFDSGDHVEVSFHKLRGNGQIKECGIDFLYCKEDRTKIWDLKSSLLSGSMDIYRNVDFFDSLVPTKFFNRNFNIYICWSCIDEYLNRLRSIGLTDEYDEMVHKLLGDQHGESLQEDENGFGEEEEEDESELPSGTNNEEAKENSTSISEEESNVIIPKLKTMHVDNDVGAAGMERSGSRWLLAHGMGKKFSRHSSAFGAKWK